MKRIFHFLNLNLILILSTASNSHSQQTLNSARWQQIIVADKPAHIKITSALYQLSKLSLEDKIEAASRLETSGLRFNKSTGEVNIEIIYRHVENIGKIKDDIDRSYLESKGFRVNAIYKNRVSAWVPLEMLLGMEATLSEEYKIMEVHTGLQDNEGPSYVNSTSYVNGASMGGAGKRIAIIDGDFDSIQTSVASAVAKNPAYVWKSGAASNLAAIDTGITHGTSCSEIAFDHAPNASYEYYLVDNYTERGAAVTQCIANGVNIISQSLSAYNTGWADNSGVVCEAAQDAADNGILFFTSCGNRAASHFEGGFIDNDGDGQHEFVIAGPVEVNSITTALPNNSRTHCYLSWNPVAGSDYDIFIINTTTNAILASSTNTGNDDYEFLSWGNNTGAPVSVGFRVIKKAGATATPTFEMFTHNAGNYQFATAAGSNTSPSNSTDLNIISVGAVARTSYTSVPGTDPISPSSSLGPTNSGNLAPKIASPTNCNTLVDGGVFTGTSCATPNAAGMAAAFWSSNPQLDATGVRQIIFRKAQLFKDWGVAGNDNTYGYGGVYLLDYAANQRYMFRTSANAAITNNTRPYYNLDVAQDNSPNNGTIIILNNGNYSETGTFGIPGTGSGKKILYKSPFTSITGNIGF